MGLCTGCFHDDSNGLRQAGIPTEKRTRATPSAAELPSCSSHQAIPVAMLFTRLKLGGSKGGICR